MFTHLETLSPVSILKTHKPTFCSSSRSGEESQLTEEAEDCRAIYFCDWSRSKMWGRNKACVSEERRGAETHRVKASLSWSDSLKISSLVRKSWSAIVSFFYMSCSIHLFKYEEVLRLCSTQIRPLKIKTKIQWSTNWRKTWVFLYFESFQPVTWWMRFLLSLSESCPKKSS